MGKTKLYFIKFYIIIILWHIILWPRANCQNIGHSCFHVLWVHGDKYSNTMHINNCSLEVRHKKEKGFSDNPPPQTKIKPPNALYAKYSISFFWGGHSQNDLAIIKKYFTPISLLSSISLLREPKPFNRIT